MEWSETNKDFWLKTGGALAWRTLQIAGIACLSVLSVQAAQYSFHVNSVEQGAHSTANPIMNVNEGKVEKKNGDAAASLTQDGAGSTNIETTPVTSTASAPAVDRDRDFWFRFGVSAMESRTHTDDRGRWGRAGSHLDVQGQLGIYPLSYFGFNAFGGTFSRSPHQKFLLGGELHVIPIKFDVFGMDDTFEVGVMGGVWNLIPETSSERQWASAFAGAKASFNFGREHWKSPRWSINTALRGNQNILVGDLGLAYRF